jgi:hypothetical protein
VNYQFDIVSFLRKWNLRGEKCGFTRLRQAVSADSESSADVRKFITLRPFIVSGSVSNRWKAEKLFYVSHAKF